MGSHRSPISANLRAVRIAPLPRQADNARPAAIAHEQCGHRSSRHTFLEISPTGAKAARMGCCANMRAAGAAHTFREPIVHTGRRCPRNLWMRDPVVRAMRREPAGIFHAPDHVCLIAQNAVSPCDPRQQSRPSFESAAAYDSDRIATIGQTVQSRHERASLEAFCDRAVEANGRVRKRFGVLVGEQVGDQRRVSCASSARRQRTTGLRYDQDRRRVSVQGRARMRTRRESPASQPSLPRSSCGTARTQSDI